ncbi:MAG: IS66 family transposase, partial [Endozoicomonas sp.]
MQLPTNQEQEYSPAKLLNLVTQQQEQITQQQEQIAKLQALVEALQAEIRRLKKLPPKPDIKPNTKPKDDGEEDDNGSDDNNEPPDNSGKRKVKKPGERTRKNRRQPDKPTTEQIATVEVPDVPPGSTPNGFSSYSVQELHIRAFTVEYRLKQWLTPDGQIITAKPPENLRGHHYGPQLQSYLLYQHHGCSVTQPQLLDWLWYVGISMSAGELHRLLTEGHTDFHEEKDALLATGLKCSHYIQTDDTGARHQGQNGYCTIINNELFAWFESTGSKSRENFLSLLHRPWKTYSVTQDALNYLEKFDYPEKWLRVIRQYMGVTFLNREAWEAALNDHGLTGKTRRRQADEALIYSSLIAHGLGHLTTFSDGAQQFNVFNHAQCWIHAERGLAKVHPVNEQQASAQYWCRTWFWAIYSDLKAFKASPDKSKAQNIRHDFKTLTNTQVDFSDLQDALSGLVVIEKELLQVLDNLGLPLHNNLSESQIREYVKRRKISGGTKSKAGRKCRDTFASLKKTCRLYGLSFWHYLKDRITGSGSFPWLPDL